MSRILWFVDKLYSAGGGYAHANLTFRTTVADGPVADTAEPLTAEAGRPVTQPDRNDLDAMSHD